MTASRQNNNPLAPGQLKPARQPPRLHSKGPPAVGLNTPFVIEISNVGEAVPSDAKLVALLPPKVSSGTTVGPAEMVITADSPNAWKLPCRTDLLGKQHIRLELRVDNKVETHHEYSFSAEGPELAIQVSSPTTWSVSQRAKIQVIVENRGLSAAHKILLAMDRHPGLNVEKTDAAQTSQSLQWSLAQLSARSRQTFTVECTPTQEFHAWPLRVVATENSGTRALKTVPIHVSGVVALAVSVVESVNPLAVGAVTEFTVRIENLGTGTADKVRFQLQTPARLRFLDCKGNLPITLADGKLTAGTVPVLAPGERATSQLRAQALQPGEARFSVHVFHEALGTAGLESQTSTVIYQP